MARNNFDVKSETKIPIPLLHFSLHRSAINRTWQRVRVEESSFHAHDPERTKKFRRYTPPRDFGLNNFAAFDPDSFKGKGKVISN